MVYCLGNKRKKLEFPENIGLACYLDFVRFASLFALRALIGNSLQLNHGSDTFSSDTHTDWLAPLSANTAAAMEASMREIRPGVRHIIQSKAIA